MKPLKLTIRTQLLGKTLSCGKERRVIVLLPKKGLDYKYSFLQKHNGEFTPFCLPLYGILTPEDEEKVFRIVAEKVGLKAL